LSAWISSSQPLQDGINLADRQRTAKQREHVAWIRSPSTPFIVRLRCRLGADAYLQQLSVSSSIRVCRVAQLNDLLISGKSGTMLRYRVLDQRQFCMTDHAVQRRTVDEASVSSATSTSPASLRPADTKARCGRFSKGHTTVAAGICSTMARSGAAIR